MSNDSAIHCSDHNPRPDSPICQWLTANAVDPTLIPLDSTITISGGNLTYETFVLASPGELAREDRDFSKPPVREVRTVPLTSPLEVHGLPSRDVANQWV